MSLTLPSTFDTFVAVGAIFLLLMASPLRAQAVTGVVSADLVRLVRQDCGSCHGMKLTGGLGSPLTREALADKPTESLVATILQGRPGTAMPAWKSLLSETQVQWIVARLIEGFPEEPR